MNQPFESNGIVKTVENFYESLKQHPNHRYMSWEHCFNAFRKSSKYDVDYLSLHLAFYLASWGMYRGSSALLWKDYKVHIEAVNIIKGYSAIQCNTGNEIQESQIKEILDAKRDLENYYRGIGYTKPTKTGSTEGFVSATDTLISKILLGTLGCVPAYDRFLELSLTESGINDKFSKESLTSIFDFINKNVESLKEIQSKIALDGTYYPLMKIVDMYFWEKGRLIHELTIKEKGK